MIIVPIHKILFECTNDDVVELPEILWPSYIYKIGDEFKLYNSLEGDEEKRKSPLSIYKVIDVKHELIAHADANQVIVVYVERISGLSK